jgi:hypothetical protein
MSKLNPFAKPAPFTAPHYPCDKQVAFMQGELVATARRVLAEHKRNIEHSGSESHEEACIELQRLVGNGDPVQLALVILFMHAEQYGGPL